MLADHALEHGGGSAVGSAFPLVRFLLKDPLLTVAALDDPPFRAEDRELVGPELQPVIQRHPGQHDRAARQRHVKP